jgi:branched-subunit amino acid aminotransferase/4-amino-4-deoxychorismate lyase
VNDETNDTSGILLYGKGIFTTIAIGNGEPFFWERHWRRLNSNAQILKISLAEHGMSSTYTSLLDAISASSVVDGRARITFSDESPSSIWSTAGVKTTSLSIIVAERRPIPENFKLTISPHRINTTSPLAGVKSCNYLEHLLAYEEASERGFHEAVRLNERGEIASACMANVFWEKGGRLFTPSLKTGCLPGTTREFVLENADCEEVEIGIEELETADRIFLTSAGIGVVTVAEFNGRPLAISNHPLSSLLPF